MLDDLYNYFFYSFAFHKIKTKTQGLQSFKLRKYQRDFIDLVDKKSEPVRIVVLKPRQAGFSTLVSSYLSHKMTVTPHFQGLAMADKFGRTQAISNLYKTFLNELPDQMKPMIATNNSEQILFDNPNVNLRSTQSGLNSGIVFETANDPNAGRSTSRMFAHLSEFAFYRYASEIDEGIQNSIPLEENTFIIKESTANGKAGIGKPFYDLWNLAKRGESIYKPFFVAWYEVDDYAINPPDNFKITKFEKELLKEIPDITIPNLVWRRLKLQEYQGDENSILSPEERFKQDFPKNDIEAFLSTGAPVFDLVKLDFLINQLSQQRPKNLKDIVNLKGNIVKMFWNNLTIFTPSRQGKEYFMGIDVSEGLAIGDASSICIIDQEYNQMAYWHGKIDPDLLGHLIIALAEYYNNALVVPEVNNMGQTTVTTIRNEGYSKIYRETVEDKITKEKTTKLGWRTTQKSKEVMLNETVKLFRDNALTLKDLQLLIEMSLINRGENGIVKLNGRDRVVALCLACMGRKSQVINMSRSKHETTGIDVHKMFEKSNNRKKKDIFE